MILVGSDDQYILYEGAAGADYRSIRQATFSMNDQPVYLAEHQDANGQLLYDIVLNGTVQQTSSSLASAQDVFSGLADPDYGGTSYDPDAVHAPHRISFSGTASIESVSSLDGKRTVQLVHGGTPTVRIYDYLQEGNWKSQDYSSVNGVTFSPDSKHLAYVAQDESNSSSYTEPHVVVDDQPGTHEGNVIFLQFNKNSSKLWYLDCPVDAYPGQALGKPECYIVKRVLQ